MEYNIKNMVRQRCIKVIKNIFEKNNIIISEIGLGYVNTNNEIPQPILDIIDKELQDEGFEIIKEKKEIIVDQIKVEIINQARTRNLATKKISAIISESLNLDYKYLSKLFSSITGNTIEKYYLAQRVEYIKELIEYNQLTLSDISYELGYSSVSHLSKQFKQITGITPSQYKNSCSKDRNTIDSI